MRAMAIGLLVALSLTTGACGEGGDGDGGATGSGVDGNKPLSALTTEEIGAVCDWAASLYGGYGKSVSCGNGGTTSSKASRAACMAEAGFTSCSATVYQLEGCGQAVHDVCLAALSRADCQAVLSCS